MKLQQVPQSSDFRLTPYVETRLDKRVEARNDKDAIVSFRKKAEDFLITVAVMPIFAAMEQAVNVVGFVIKAPFVFLNETLFRAFGHRSASLSYQDLLGHVDNFRRCIVIELTAAACLFYFEEGPKMMLDVVKKMNPVAAAPAPNKGAEDAAAGGAGTAVEKTPSTVDTKPVKPVVQGELPKPQTPPPAAQPEAAAQTEGTPAPTPA